MATHSGVLEMASKDRLASADAAKYDDTVALTPLETD